jgi:hypothetical protein
VAEQIQALLTYIPVSIKEDSETIEEDHKDNEEQAKVREIRLERSLEGEGVAIDTLSFAALVEANIGDENASPSDLIQRLC